MTPAGIDLIKRREKCRLVGYRPTPNDVPTNGWGHTGPEVVVGVAISQEQADATLDMDLAIYEATVRAACPVATPLQYDAMTSLCYNIGVAGFRSSSVARLHNAGRFPEAAQAFALWNKQKGVVLRELVARRAEEAAMYVSGCAIDSTPRPADDPEIVVHGLAEGEVPLTESRTMNGQAIAGGATVVGGAVSVVQSNQGTLQQVQDALGNLAPYFHWAAVAIGAVAVGGIAWSVYARWHDRNSGRS